MNKFKVGDEVTTVFGGIPNITFEKIYRIIHFSHNKGCVLIENDKGLIEEYEEVWFELANKSKQLSLEIDRNFNKIPCTCDWNEVLRYGCKDPNHR